MLKDRLPKFVVNIDEINDLINAEQAELDRVELKCKASLGEFFAATFTQKTASYWEKLLGFESAPAWSLQRRRERIQSRLLSTSPISPAVLKEIIEKTAGAEIELTEDADNYKVHVKFVGVYGVSPYIEDVKAEVARIIPFHLAVEYEYTFARLIEYEGFTLGELGSYTLDDIAFGVPLEEE